MAVSTNDKKLDGAGLSTVWGLIKSLVNGITVPTKTSDLTNDSDFVSDASYVHTDNNLTDALKSKLDGVAAGAQVNVIETVKVNGSALTVTEKAVNIPVPTDNASLANGAGYQTANDVNNLIDQKLQAYIIPKGSLAFANLPTPASTNLGWMWNMSDDFTIDNRFVEYEQGKTKTYPKGTNVYVINNGTDQSPSYMFDIYSGFVDLSNYATLDDVEALTTAEIQAICV